MLELKWTLNGSIFTGVFPPNKRQRHCARDDSAIEHFLNFKFRAVAQTLGWVIVELIVGREERQNLRSARLLIVFHHDTAFTIVQ